MRRLASKRLESSGRNAATRPLTCAKRTQRDEYRSGLKDYNNPTHHVPPVVQILLRSSEELLEAIGVVLDSQSDSELVREVFHGCRRSRSNHIEVADHFLSHLHREVGLVGMP